MPLGFTTRKQTIDQVDNERQTRVAAMDRRSGSKRMPLEAAKQRAKESREEYLKSKPNFLQRAMVDLTRKNNNGGLMKAMEARAAGMNEVEKEYKRQQSKY